MLKFKKTQLDVEKKHKIILVGPQAVGKSTFKKVFFENVNPLKLLDNGLEPTRGIDSSVYSYFNQMIGVWDLAGQELDTWLGDRKDVFSEAEVIVCMVEANQKLKETVTFLVRFLKIREEVARFSKLFLLIHKCDLVAELQLYNKLVNIEKFIEVRFPKFKDLCKRTSFYKTSIMKQYFLPTLMVAFDVVKTCIKKETIRFTLSEFKEIKKKIQILLLYSEDVWFSAEDTRYKINLPFDLTLEYLKDLQIQGYLMMDKKIHFCLTEKGAHFKKSCKEQEEVIKKRQSRENIGLFLNINQKKQFDLDNANLFRKPRKLV